MTAENTHLLQRKFKISQLRDIWHDFCEHHAQLYELTCDEYMHLLASDIDQLEITINDKKELLNTISKIDQSRNEIVTDLAISFGVEKIETLNDLLQLLEANHEIELKKEIDKRNLLLLDIINKIQAQNKKNQFFLNKAIYSLKELKDSFSGQNSYKTYSSTGMTKSSNY